MAHAFFVAVAGGVRPRARNKHRESFTTDEDLVAAIRLTAAEIDVLALEYNQWRSVREGVNANYDASYRKSSIFLTYLARRGYFHQIALSSGTAKSTAIMQIHDVAQFFASTAHQWIALPQATELAALASPLQHHSRGQVQVVLYIIIFIAHKHL